MNYSTYILIVKIITAERILAVIAGADFRVGAGRKDSQLPQ